MKLTIIRTNHVGFETGVCLAQNGREIICLVPEAELIEPSETANTAVKQSSIEVEGKHSKHAQTASCDLAPNSNHLAPNPMW